MLSMTTNKHDTINNSLGTVFALFAQNLLSPAPALLQNTLVYVVCSWEQ